MTALVVEFMTQTLTQRLQIFQHQGTTQSIHHPSCYITWQDIPANRLTKPRGAEWHWIKANTQLPEKVRPAETMERSPDASHMTRDCRKCSVWNELSASWNGKFGVTHLTEFFVFPSDTCAPKGRGHALKHTCAFLFVKHVGKDQPFELYLGWMLTWNSER